MVMEAEAWRTRLEAAVTPALLARLAQASQQAAAAGLPTYLAGGSVRDVLLGRPTTDLDLVVVPARESDPAPAPRLARALARAHGGEVTAHSAFGTATWRGPDGTSLDLATARTETYAFPGALPTVAPTTEIALDLRRRDFTINAMALRVDGGHFGELVDLQGGQADLAARLVQVLHPQSFQDDPTRLFRAERYASRLDFRIANHTKQLIHPSLPIMSALSGERLRHELELTFGEADAPLILERLDLSSALRAVHPALQWTASESADARLIGGLPRLTWQWAGPLELEALYLALLLRGADAALAAAALERLAVSRATFEAVTGALRLDLTGERPSEVVAQLDTLSLAGVVSAYVARPETRARVDAYLSRWRHIRAKLTGDDLVALGLAPGPDFRRILSRLRAARLDGEVDEAGELALARTLAGLNEAA